MDSWLDFQKEAGIDNPFIYSSDIGYSVNERALLVSCHLCNNPIFAHHLDHHLESCGKVDVQQTMTSTTVLKPSKNPNPTTKGKKKMAETPTNSLIEKKKLKLEKKKILDLDRQCGVLMESGEVCARSLKCKIHSISLKRQVQGRSQLFDILFNEFTRKIPKQEIQLEILSPEREMSCILQQISQYHPLPLANSFTCILSQFKSLKDRMILLDAFKKN